MGYAAKLGSSGKGKLAVVNLGTGTSINCKTHAVLKDYYTELTVDNFYYRIASSSGSRSDVYSTLYQSNSVGYNFTLPSFSYNAITGILNCGNSSCRGWTQGYKHTGGTGTVTISGTAITTAYCVYLE